MVMCTSNFGSKAKLQHRNLLQHSALQECNIQPYWGVSNEMLPLFLFKGIVILHVFSCWIFNFYLFHTQWGHIELFNSSR